MATVSAMATALVVVDAVLKVEEVALHVAEVAADGTMSGFNAMNVLASTVKVATEAVVAVAAIASIASLVIAAVVAVAFVTSVAIFVAI